MSWRARPSTRVRGDDRPGGGGQGVGEDRFRSGILSGARMLGHGDSGRAVIRLRVRIWPRGFAQPGIRSSSEGQYARIEPADLACGPALPWARRLAIDALGTSTGAGSCPPWRHAVRVACRSRGGHRCPRRCCGSGPWRGVARHRAMDVPGVDPGVDPLAPAGAAHGSARGPGAGRPAPGGRRLGAPGTRQQPPGAAVRRAAGAGAWRPGARPRWSWTSPSPSTSPSSASWAASPSCPRVRPPASWAAWGDPHHAPSRPRAHSVDDQGRPGWAPAVAPGRGIRSVGAVGWEHEDR